MARVFDGFLYHNKPEMLELHLENLAAEVEAFVMVQSTRTFTGIPRRVVTLDELGLGRFNNKVIQISFSLDTEVAADHRETFQRNLITGPLAAGGITDDDVVIISDLDEIVNPAVVRQLASDPSPFLPFGKVRFQMQLHYYFLNCLTEDPTKRWPLCVAILWGRLKRSSCQQERMMVLSTPHDFAVELPDAGWHFSFFGTPEQVKETLLSHVEPMSRDVEHLSVEEVRDFMQNGKYLVGRDVSPLRFVEELPPLPQTVTNKLDYYRSLGWLRQ